MIGACDLFGRSNKVIRFDANRQMFLDNEAAAWIVDQGTVNIFVSPANDQGIYGRRHYIAEFEAGDILFGVKPYFYENGSVSFLCSGVGNSRLVEIELSDMQEALQDENKAEQIYYYIEKWVSSLNKCLLGFQSIIENAGDKNVNRVTLIDELNRFNQNIVKMSALFIQGMYNDEKRKIELKQHTDEIFVKDSLKRLADISGWKKKNTVIAGRRECSGNSYAAVCQMVGEVLGIKIKIPNEVILSKSKDILYDIMRTTHIRYRQVILSGEWWKTDNGPFLGFIGENEPVALIPVNSRSYKMVNPIDCSEAVITREITSEILPKAYMFYKSLPNTELNAGDLVKFCSSKLIKKDVMFVMLMGILGGILNMFIPIANGILFDRIIPEGNRGQLVQMALILGSFGISGALFQIVRSFAMVRIEGKTDTWLQAAIWDRVVSLPVPFFRQFTAGELTMRTMGIDQIRKAISGTAITTMLSSVFSVFNFVLLFKYSTKMAFYALFLVLVSVAVTFTCVFLQLRFKRDLIRLSNKISGQVLQIIGGIAKFRVAGAEKRAFSQWVKEYGRQKEIELKNDFIENILTTFNSIFPIITLLMIFLAASNAHGLEAGSFIAFNSAFTGFMAAMLALSGVILTVNDIVPTYENIKPIIRTLPEYDSIKEDPGELDGSIELTHVTFRYKPDAPAVINDLSLKINKGEYLAIVGASGCGKSTILRLLLGFERPEAGKIYYGGHDIEKVDLRSIRRQLGVVMQNGQVMAGDIKSNIIGTNPNLGMEDAIEAAKLAGIYEDIEAMPMGMFTVVSEGGSTLSGGQRQRLLIARVIANKPKFIFFDEATSALDNKAQAIVSNSIDTLRATRVVIAHRLSTIINCDRIIVIDKGRIIEEGTYEELMNNGNMFYDFAKRQLA